MKSFLEKAREVIIARTASNSTKTIPTTRLARSPPLEIPLPPDDPYSFLSTFNTRILVDDSGSMAGRSWGETARTLSAIAPIVTKYDKNGIDIHFTNHISNDVGAIAEGSASGGYRNIQNAASVKDIFETIEPQGSIPIHTRLQHILNPYLTKLEEERAKEREVKPLNLIVLTDSIPSDDIESILSSTAKELDRLNAPSVQVGVHFFQVGEEERREDGLEKNPLGSKGLNLPLPSRLGSFHDLQTVEKICDSRSRLETIASFRFLRRMAGKLLATSFSPLLLSSLAAGAGATNPSKPNVPDSSRGQDPSEIWHSILWGLGLIVCFGVIQWKAKRIETQGRSADGNDNYQIINIMENLKAASEFSSGVTVISSLATLLSGCSERISETTLVSATVFNFLLNYKYTRLSLRQFKLERIYTATIAVAGCRGSYTIATTAPLLLDPVGRYKNNTILMFAILPIVLFAISYVTCAILEDTDFGRDMDGGEYRFAIQQYIARRTGLDFNARDLEAARQSQGPHVDANRGAAPGNDAA